MQDHRRMNQRNGLHPVVCGLLLAAWGLLAAVGATAQPAASVEALVAQGADAGVDAALMQQVAQRAEAAGFTEAQTAQLLRPAVELAGKELPANGVLQKALEGLAKRVPPPRIEPVLAQMRAHTEQAGAYVRAWAAQPDARAALGGKEGRALERAARDRLIEGAAQARFQNAPADVVQQLLETVPAATQRRPLPAGEIATALQVLPELLGDGASSQATIELLTSALDAGYGPSNLRQLPTAVRTARQQNPQPVDVIARNAARAIADGTPAADVLGRLFDGGLPGGPPSEVGGPPENIPPGQGKPPDTPPGRGGNPSGNDPPGRGGGS